MTILLRMVTRSLRLLKAETTNSLLAVLNGSPFRVKEDDEVDNSEIKFTKKGKSKRIYQSPPPEVGQKINRSLKSLNAKTGLFSKRMKIIHGDHVLHAQRVFGFE